MRVNEMTVEPDSVVLDLGSGAGAVGSWTDDAIYYRRLQPSDMEECKALHRSLFPIDYEEEFYTSALSEANGIITLAAMQRRLAPSGGGSGGSGGKGGSGGRESTEVGVSSSSSSSGGGAGAREEMLVGVVTVKLSPGVEAEDVDVERWLPGKSDAAAALAWIFGSDNHSSERTSSSSSSATSHDDVSTFLPPSTPFAYILTLGTLKSHRRLGIASKLLEQVVARARHEHGCKVVYLHVITHNESAIQFYRGHRFSRVRRLVNFYSIPDDKGPEPGVTHYDSYLFVRRSRVDPRRRSASTSPLASLAAAWEAAWRLGVVVARRFCFMRTRTKRREL